VVPRHLRTVVAQSRARWLAARLALRVAEVLNQKHLLQLEYRPAAENVPRWGRGRPSHPGLAAILDGERESYRRMIDQIVSAADGLSAIQDHTGSSDREPRWNPGNIPGLDGAALYAFVAARTPATYLEVGSGNSTKFVARAIRDDQLSTRVVSIDPNPRAEIDDLCDEIIRGPLESADLSVFETLRAGDVVFFDGSHRAFMNSDVVVFFLDILPQLPDGILVGIHDITLPDDYVQGNAGRYWSEQYVLAAFLLGGHTRTRVAFPAWFVSQDPELGQELDRLWDRLPPVERHGDSFWLETVALDGHSGRYEG
jgi:hypothetical protein